MSPHHTKKAFHPRTSLLSSIGVALLVSFGFALLSPQLAGAVDITLGWNANSEADLDGYRIFYREDGESYDYNSPDWEGTDTTCTISNLDDNTEYHFVARAFDTSDNESADSQEISYTTYTILLSLSSDRSDPTALQDETVSNNIFAFVSPTSGINEVSFFLDDPEMSSDPYQVEEVVNYHRIV